MYIYTHVVGVSSTSTHVVGVSCTFTYMWWVCPVHPHTCGGCVLYIHTHVVGVSCTSTHMWWVCPVQPHTCGGCVQYIHTHVVGFDTVGHYYIYYILHLKSAETTSKCWLGLNTCPLAIFLQISNVCVI